MRIVFFLITVIITTFSQQQELYIPRNIEDAYYFNTRSHNGKPGENYWLNKAEYNLDVEIVPPERKVIGSGTITYYNNSPDDLNSIVLRTYQDFYKIGNSRDWQIDPKAVNEGLIIAKLLVNGDEFKESISNGSYERSGTNLTIHLTNPLKSQDSIKLDVTWSFKIPLESRLRMGAYDDKSFFVSYWYPQIAVYDDIDGWDTIDYKGTSEMYNDFNDYSVKVTVPNNFLVWSTGLLQNKEEVLSEPFCEKINEAIQTEKMINIVTIADLESKNITKQNDKNTWIYKACNVPDFAFGTSDHYLWDATSLEVEPGRRVLIQSAYKKASKDFSSVAKIAKETIHYFSTDLPGVPFPYPAMTVFNGHGGMEYPMIINDGSEEFISSTIRLTSHEIAHTYFPFFMGTNERKYAWMDEGWAVMLPFDFQIDKAPNADPKLRSMSRLKTFSGQEMEMPPMTPNQLLTGEVYRTATYARPALAYDYLREALGDDLFKKALREYISRWNGKHPIPYDFFFTFNDVVGEDLSWFWKPWFFDRAFGDLAIEKVFTYEDKYEVFIKNVGGLPLPVQLEIKYEDGSKETRRKSVEIWKYGNKEYIFEVEREKNIKSITLGEPHILDVDDINNEVIVN